MTIIHIITGLGGGGAEHMVLELAKQNLLHGIDTVVISVSSSKKIEYKFKEAGINYHFLNIHSFSTFWQGLKRFNQIVSSKDNAVLHCHMFHASMLAVFNNIIYKKFPIVFTLHTNSVKQLHRRLLLFLSKPLRKKDIIFSRNSKKWYLKNNSVIPNGIDIEKFQTNVIRNYNSTKPFEFLFLGRLYEPKNPLFLINLAIKLGQNGHSNFKINVVGDGVMRRSLENKIKDANLESIIVLHGFQKDVMSYLNNAHCLIMPSLWEGMPVSIIESAVAKLPIIATPVGSIPDFLNSNNALVSNLDQFHLSMINVMTNYDDAILKSEQLYNETLVSFDINTIFNKHNDVYQSV